MARLFFSYSHRDEDLRDQLETHLSALQRQGLIEAWHDRRLIVGTELGPDIDAEIERADIILLLVSPDFVASDYCYTREMTRALERHEAGEAVVIPVILRPTDWHDLPFGKLLATPKDGRPVTMWANIDEAFLDITKAIKGALRKSGAAAIATSRPTATGPVEAKPPEPRSSNLRVSKRFTDRDRDLFLHEAFEYMARFFENSLTELSQRNVEIDGNFRRLDANRFTAIAYRDGESVAACSIVLGPRGSFMGGIAFSHNAEASTNSFNESLSVENDDQTLYLKPLGMSRFGGGDAPEKLTPQGGAELFWDLFIAPLQRD